MRKGWHVGGGTVVAALVGLCALAGCSSSHGDAVGRSTTTTASVPSSTTTPSTAASSTTTKTSPAAAVIAGYRAASSAFEQALSTANPNTVQLR